MNFSFVCDFGDHAVIQSVLAPFIYIVGSANLSIIVTKLNRGVIDLDVGLIFPWGHPSLNVQKGQSIIVLSL